MQVRRELWCWWARKQMKRSESILPITTQENKNPSNPGGGGTGVMSPPNQPESDIFQCIQPMRWWKRSKRRRRGEDTQLPRIRAIPMHSTYLWCVLFEFPALFHQSFSWGIAFILPVGEVGGCCVQFPLKHTHAFNITHLSGITLTSNATTNTYTTSICRFSALNRFKCLVDSPLPPDRICHLNSLWSLLKHWTGLSPHLSMVIANTG